MICGVRGSISTLCEFDAHRSQRFGTNPLTHPISWVRESGWVGSWLGVWMGGWMGAWMSEWVDGVGGYEGGWGGRVRA